MVQGVSAAGDSGSLKNMREYQVFYKDYLDYKEKNPESSVNFEGWLMLKGKMAYYTQQMENYVETGNSRTSDGENGNTLKNTKHVSSNTGAIYQSEDEDTYYQFDYETGEYRVLHGTDEVKAALGFSEDQNVDMIEFGYWSAKITDITFGDLEDGQDTTLYNVNSKYTNVTVTDQEFDIHYILNALLMDPSDPQYQIAKGVFDKLCKNTSQWLPQADLDMLNEVAEKYGTNSAEYKAVLKDVLLSNLDQANEWVEEHTHIKNTASLEQVGSTGATDGTNGSDGTNPETPVVPEYDKDSVLSNTSLYGDYKGNKSSSCSGYDSKSKVINEGMSNFATEAKAKLNEVASALRSQLQSSMGDAYTSEIDSYIDKAISKTIDHFLSDCPTLSTDYGGGGNYRTRDSDNTIVYARRKNNAGRITYNNKNLIDYFFNEFNTISANGGKSAEEVAAEQKAAEEKAAKEESGYKSLYNMDMQSTAKEANADKDVQVVNASSAAEIQAKAESSILNPLINKIKSKLSGQGIPDADLTTILSNASSYALSTCTEWASASNDYVYTIDADKVISKFEDAVKESVKNKGYNF